MAGLVSQWLPDDLRSRVTIADISGTRQAIGDLAASSSLPHGFGGTCSAMPPDVRAACGLEGLRPHEIESLLPRGKLAKYAIPTDAARA